MIEDTVFPLVITRTLCAVKLCLTSDSALKTGEYSPTVFLHVVYS